MIIIMMTTTMNPSLIIVAYVQKTSRGGGWKVMNVYHRIVMIGMVRTLETTSQVHLHSASNARELCGGASWVANATQGLLQPSELTCTASFGYQK